MKGSMLVTRVSAAVVAVVAGYVSYMHIVDVAMAVGERPEIAYALPVTIDALMVMSTLAMLADRRAGRRPSAWAQAGFLFGVAVSVTCNVASAAPTWPARGVAAIPAVSLLLAVRCWFAPAAPTHVRTPTGHRRRTYHHHERTQPRVSVPGHRRRTGPTGGHPSGHRRHRASGHRAGHPHQWCWRNVRTSQPPNWPG